MTDKPTPTQRLAAGLNASAEQYEGKWKRRDYSKESQTTLGKGYEQQMKRDGYFRDKTQADRHLGGSSGRQ